MKKIIILILIVAGCTTGRKQPKQYEHIADMLPQDYIDYLSSTGNDYLQLSNVKEYKINQS